MQQQQPLLAHCQPWPRSPPVAAGTNGGPLQHSTWLQCCCCRQQGRTVGPRGQGCTGEGLWLFVCWYKCIQLLKVWVAFGQWNLVV
jgi:hypothetical protein